MSKKIQIQDTEDNQTIAKMYKDRFECTDKPWGVFDNSDEQKMTMVRIFMTPNTPCVGVSSFGTIGISDVPLILNSRVQDFRLELIAAAPTDCREFDNALATAAYCIMKDAWPCYPGAWFPDILDMYEISRTLSDLCFVDPFLWGSDFETIQLKRKRVAFLQAIPISRKESAYIDIKGFEALSEIFVKEKIDVLDIDRQSVIR